MDKTDPSVGPYWHALAGLEAATVLDPLVEAAAPLAGKLVASEPWRGFFHGDATGIPPHVILTDVPFGAWFMAQFLDLFNDEGTQRAAGRLIGLGVLAAVPTALAGWAEWARTDATKQRPGLVHAGCNAFATCLFAGSWVARRRGAHGTGVWLARAADIPLLSGAFIGGNLRGGHVRD